MSAAFVIVFFVFFLVALFAHRRRLGARHRSTVSVVPATVVIVVALSTHEGAKAPDLGTRHQPAMSIPAVAVIAASIERAAIPIGTRSGCESSVDNRLWCLCCCFICRNSSNIRRASDLAVGHCDCGC